MGIYEIRIPDYLPMRLNELLRAHWAVRRSAQRAADSLVNFYGISAGVPRAQRRRRVSLTFHGGRADPDARLKLILDALVHGGYLVDDSEKWCLIDPPKNAPGPRAVTIQLEDLPGGEEISLEW